MNKKIILALSFSVFSTACTTTATQPVVEEEVITMNNYPTRDRVEYVFNCIAKHGGLSGSQAYINQYACGCKIDKIAEKLTFEEFEGAKTFSYLKKIPGENGGVFRDPKQSKSLRTRLKEADAYAEKQCFVL